jgi:hypothetical protein
MLLVQKVNKFDAFEHLKRFLSIIRWYHWNLNESFLLILLYLFAFWDMIRHALAWINIGDCCLARFLDISVGSIGATCREFTSKMHDKLNQNNAMMFSMSYKMISSNRWWRESLDRLVGASNRKHFEKIHLWIGFKRRSFKTMTVRYVSK